MNTESKIKGCLAGIAIGDALGMPVETMKHEEIMAHTGGAGITRFVDPIIRRDWLKGLKAGDTTDDWQLTRAVARSLIRTHGQFDVADCAAEHVRELEQSRFGWGKTTQSAIEAIKRGERVPGRDPLPPALPGKGCGNGIIMKVAPLAIAEASKIPGSGEYLWRDVKALGSMTHPDIRASIAAYAVTLMLMDALTEYDDDSTELRWPPSTMLAVVTEGILEIEEMEDMHTVPDRVSKRLDRLDAKTLGTAESLRAEVGSGFHALETVAFAIGVYLRHPKDFRAGVLEAVNAGGDTDTNASIVGGLIGATVGIEAMPQEWKESLPCLPEVLGIAEELCAVLAE